MKTDNQPICFILLPGFSPDNYPVLNLKKRLEERGHVAIANNFYGARQISNFSDLTAQECQANLRQTIQKARNNHEKVVGIGVSLGGALLLDYAKSDDGLDAVISVGTPFKIKNAKMIRVGQFFIPAAKPFCFIFNKLRRRQLPPIPATRMVMDYLSGEFISDLEKISAPVLFLHSKKDKITDYRALKEYSDKLSSHKKEIIFFDNGSHVINGGTEKILNFTFDFLESL